MNALLLTAVLAAVPEHWVSFREMGTGICVGLPGGRVRYQPYGVGGSGYRLYEGFEVPGPMRDFVCRSGSPLALGARGDLAYVSDDPKRVSREVVHVDPRATKIAVLASTPCVLLDTGKLVCPREYDGRPAYVQRLADELNARGPIARMVPGSTCALTVAGSVVCGLAQSPGLGELWSGVQQAALVPGGRNDGCAVTKDGAVSCLGENRYGQRGTKARVARDVANTVEGLPRIAEVAVSGGHTCARDVKGEVWCWGLAMHGQLGEDGLDGADRLPKCELDTAAMTERDARIAAMRKQCAANRPKHPHGDDVCGRMMWNLDRSGTASEPIYQHDGRCETSEKPVRIHPLPVKVPGVKDAAAIAVSGTMSCALTRTQKLVCWGFETEGLQALQLPGAPVVEAPMPARAAVPRASLTAAIGTGVCGERADGSLAWAALGEDGIPRDPHPVIEAIDHLCLPGGHCHRSDAGVVSCATPDRQPFWGGVPQPDDAPGVLTDQACLLRDDGIARCGPGFGSSNANTRQSNALSAVGPIAALSGACAVYTDGSLRCSEAQPSTPPRKLLDGTKGLAGTIGAGQLACVLMADGTVRCGSAFGADAGMPAPIEGLAGAEEIAGDGQHFCARAKDGDVFCWGAANQGQTGKDGFAVAKKLPQCPVDEASTARVRAQLDATPECHGQKSASCRPTYYLYGPGCTTPGDGNQTTTHAAAMKVPGLRGAAVAIFAGQGLSCALLATGAVACWGAGRPAVRTTQLFK